MLYEPQTLVGVIAPLYVPGNFLRSLFFSAASIEFDTADVKFDRVFDDLRAAPWVSPLALGSMSPDRTFQTDSFAPGYVKPKKRIEADKIKQRRPGEPIGGGFSLAQRRDLYFTDYLLGQKTQIERREEIMASQILLNGYCVMEGKDYPRAVVDFKRKASLTRILLPGAGWGQNGVSAVDSLEGFIEDIATECGAAPSHVVMDKLAGRLLKADTKLKDKLDTTLGQTSSAIDLGFKPGVAGSPVYLGRIGVTEIYIYNDNYEDTDGTIKPLLPDYTVIAGAPAAFGGTPCYGAIQDPRNEYGAARLFSKHWIDDDPAGEFLMTQSAPVFVAKRINAAGRMTVRS